MDETVAALQIAYHVSGGRLGRRRLADVTGLTEMATRIELERLRDRGLVVLPRSGAELTPAGRRRFAPLLNPIRSVAEVSLTSLRVDDVNLGAHIAERMIGPAWDLRDHAIREGASGLLLLRFGRDGWAFAHNEEPVRLHNKDDASKLDKAFPDPQTGDLLVVASGPDIGRTRLGLWRVILHTLSHSS